MHRNLGEIPQPWKNPVGDFLRTVFRGCFIRGVLVCAIASSVLSQSSSTGAIRGTVTDPSGAVVFGVSILITNATTGQAVTVETQQNGTYLAPYLPPSTYLVEASKAGFKLSKYQDISVHVAETQTVDIELIVGSVVETLTVQAAPSLLQTDSVALGHVTNQEMVVDLPLATRNYTQIIGLSPGVSSEVNNAGNLGRGSSSQSASTGGASASGGATNDNNFQLNGLEVNDAMGSFLTLGVPVPNPDAIQEFKVQTGQYDASYGRNAGANVDVVTKAGTNQFHGTAFEFLRNDVLNANAFFRNANGQPRPPLKQNQFGFSLGGPIMKNKLQFFTSYQGTRQRNGLDTSAACLSTFSTPPLTNDRSSAALGALFNGPSGGAIAPDGSNISPMALALLQAKLKDGAYLIPTPQTINSALPFAVQGSSSVTDPCTYDEDQLVANIDYAQSSKSSLAGRFFFADSTQVATLAPNQTFAAPSVPGFPVNTAGGFRVFSLTHTYTFTPHLLNQASVGFHREVADSVQQQPAISLPGGNGFVPFSYSDLGVTVPPEENGSPAILLGGGALNLGGLALTTLFAENAYDLNDTLAYVHGRHAILFGGGISRTQINLGPVGFSPTLFFNSDPSYSSFLLGNPLFSIDLVGLTNREWRSWNGDIFAQDNEHLSPRFSLQLGLRYERIGALGDRLGRASIVNTALLNPNPPNAGSVAGYVVGSNFSGSLPAGVTRGNNDAAIDESGQNAWGPRIGFSWQVRKTDRLVLRGGYGIYYSRPTGQPYLQLVTAPPFSQIRQFGSPDVTNPFAPIPPSPFFAPYSLSSDLTPITLSSSFRPPIVQQYGMNMQAKISQDAVFELGYQGSRGTRLVEGRSFNQALSASASNPIRGETSNTFANITSRVPFIGFDPNLATILESTGISWYNAMTASVNKRFSRGLQLLASYTWASALTIDSQSSTGLNGGVALGDQNNPRSRYGFNDFVRPQRFVLSYLYSLPGPRDHFSSWGRLLGQWSVAGVTTIQSGQRLSLVETNSLNAYGINQPGIDFAQFAPGCGPDQAATHGSVNSRLNSYFNSACFTAPAVVGADGIATGFGNARAGVVSGPAQQDFDISIIKQIRLPGHRESPSLEFRAEFFNAFNTPQFANPVTNVGTVGCNVSASVNGTPCNQVVGGPTQPQVILTPNPGFGQVLSTSVNPRIIQLGLKFRF